MDIPYVLGALAYRTGADCPFQEGTEEFTKWSTGWEDQCYEDMDFSADGLENDE